MRRTLILFAASVAAIAFVPALALAHRHHHRSHTTHVVRHRRFGSNWNESSGQGQTAGTVASFDNGVLTITLNDGSSVSGQVTNDTEMECTASSSSNTQSNEGSDGGDNSQSSGDNSQSGGDGNSSASGDDGSNATTNNAGEDGSGDNQGGDEQMCTSSSLAPGTTVAEANLEVTNSGGIWQKVELITS